MPEEGVGSPVTEVKGSCNLFELKPVSLKEYHVFSIT